MNTITVKLSITDLSFDGLGELYNTLTDAETKEIDISLEGDGLHGTIQFYANEAYEIDVAIEFIEEVRGIGEAYIESYEIDYINRLNEYTR